MPSSSTRRRQKRASASSESARAGVARAFSATDRIVKLLNDGLADAQGRCDASVSENTRLVLVARDLIEQSRRRLAEHETFLA
jgi:aspartate oxidase